MLNQDQILVLLNIYLQQIFSTINYLNKEKEFNRIMSYINHFLSEHQNFVIITNNVILLDLEAKYQNNFQKISRLDNLIFHFNNCEIQLRCNKNYIYLIQYKNSEQISYFYIQKSI